MIAAGTGLAVGGTADNAALEASLEAVERSGADRADLALVFVTGDAHPRAHEALHAVRRVTGARAVLGCSGSGILTERREVEDELAVAVLVVRCEQLVATPFSFARQGERQDLGTELAQRIGSTVAEGGCALVLPDALGCNPAALLAQLHEALGFVPVLGAVAAGAPMFELYNTEAAQGALVGVALSGLAPVIGVAQGCTPIGEPYVITHAEANVIQRIGSRPALEMLGEAIRALPDAEARIRQAGVFAGLAMDPAKSPLERGDFLVRNLVGADRASGALAVAEHVRVGQTLQFQIRDAQASRDDLCGMLDEVAARLGGRRPAFGCYFDCAGRGRGLFGVPDHDVTLIRARLGEFPLVGFFGNGEFAPIGRRNFFHNYTGALVIFPEA
ncbi:MAG TPA: FIST N-terminal domain-containing protein [Candidatus Binatia bacterium]|nr:FIST N-terminal domain-containing protein [Candidatus Binatia bacterium]